MTLAEEVVQQQQYFPPVGSVDLRGELLPRKVRNIQIPDTRGIIIPDYTNHRRPEDNFRFLD